MTKNTDWNDFVRGFADGKTHVSVDLAAGYNASTLLFRVPADDDRAAILRMLVIATASTDNNASPMVIERFVPIEEIVGISVIPRIAQSPEIVRLLENYRDTGAVTPGALSSQDLVDLGVHTAGVDP